MDAAGAGSHVGLSISAAAFPGSLAGPVPVLFREVCVLAA